MSASPLSVTSVFYTMFLVLLNRMGFTCNSFPFVGTNQFALCIENILVIVLIFTMSNVLTRSNLLKHRFLGGGQYLQVLHYFGVKSQNKLNMVKCF